MKTISDYTIYCTESQVRKALELNVPIENVYYNVVTKEALKRYNLVMIGGREYKIPTVEQMIGWLRYKNIHIVVHKDVVDKWSAYGHNIEPIEFTVFDRLIGFNSYEEATLAAIDAALNHLVDNKLF